MLAQRLRRNQRHLGKWARRNSITCYRLYERDIPDQPLIVDWYEGRALVYAMPRKRDETEEQRESWLSDVESQVIEGLDVSPENLYFKQRERQKGLTRQYEKIAERREEFVVREGGHSFIVNLSDYLDTGLFLDHRITRSHVGTLAAGKRMLNLFAYTGSFSVYAAKGTALSTTTVDLSNTYLSWAERNFYLNGLSPQTNAIERADVMRWLPDARRRGRRFALIVCDPPTFSNSKRMPGAFDVGADHPDLLNGCLQLLDPGGILIFSTNDRRFQLKADRLLPCELKEITQETIPPDYRNRKIHRCWEMRV